MCGNYTAVGDAPSTIATVGTNLVNITTGRRQEVTVRELGGCMAPIWHNYYSDCHALMFMVDLSNHFQLSAACIQLLDVLSHDNVQKVPILLILNKLDRANCISRLEFDAIIRLDDLLRHCRQPLSIVEVSAKDGQGLPKVTQWIKEYAKHQT
ncbi:ADP-ribosylation factor-like protein 16 [Lamellibrachia satsuma]|nr:ADP-ribosylation factor-like protein 16 [Lamellibrachia satsuma]